MTLTRSHLLERLQAAISADEWDLITNDTAYPVSSFNRSVLSGLRCAVLHDDKILPENQVCGLHTVLRDFLAEHMADKPESWKWILISCIYLTFIAERPMHPIDTMGIKVTAVDGKTIYECPSKSAGDKTACHYCVCVRMSNYEITKRRMQKEFLRYDQEKMIQRFHLPHDPGYIYIQFVGRRYRICRNTGKISPIEDLPATANEAGHNEAMTIYDILCCSKEGCCLSGAFVNMKSLSSIHGSPSSVGNGLFQDTEKRFDHKTKALAQACEHLNGVRTGKGDVSYQIPLFDFLPIVFQFWDSDEEFPPSLQIFTDKNILDYMHYETVWFAVSHLLERIKEELEDILTL